MARIQEFVATATPRTDDKGFAAFETLGRRVGGQFDQAGNDLRDIGRVQAASINSIGRWPFNIIDLEQRQVAVLRGGQGGAGGGGSGGGGGFRLARDRSGGGGGGSPRAFNQMSEGAGAMGQMLGGMGGTMSPEYRRYIQDQQDREQKRQDQLNQAAANKRWDEAVKQWNDYKKDLNKSTQDWFDKNPSSSNTNDENSPYYPQSPDYGGATGPESGWSSPVAEAPIDPDYGGGGSSSTWDSIVSGLGSMFSSSDTPVAEAPISDYNPNW